MFSPISGQERLRRHLVSIKDCKSLKMSALEMNLVQKLAFRFLTDEWEDLAAWGDAALKFSVALGCLRSLHPELLESRSGHYGPDGRWVRQWRFKQPQQSPRPESSSPER